MAKQNVAAKGKSLGLMPKCAVFRQHAGLTKAALANRSGVSRDTVAKVERHEPVTLEKLHLMAKVLEDECERPSFSREKEIQPV